VSVSRRTVSDRSSAWAAASSVARPNSGAGGSGKGTDSRASTAPAMARGVRPRNTAAWRAARSRPVRLSAAAMARTVAEYGARRSPCSSALIARALTPARSASASWDSLAARR